MNALQRLLDAFGARLIAWGVVLRRPGNAPDAEGAAPFDAEREPFDARQHWLERTAHVAPQAWRRGARQRALPPSSLPPRDARPTAGDTPRHGPDAQTRVPPALVVAAERETRAPSVARGADAPAASSPVDDAGMRPERRATVPLREPGATATTNLFGPAPALFAAVDEASVPKRAPADADAPSRRAATPTASSESHHVAAPASAAAPAVAPAPRSAPLRPWWSSSRGPKAAPRRGDPVIEPKPSSAPPVQHRADRPAPVDDRRFAVPFAPSHVERVERPAERKGATPPIAPTPSAVPELATAFEPLDRSQPSAQPPMPALRSAPPDRHRPDTLATPAPRWPDLPPWPDPADAGRRVPDPQTLQRRQRLELEQRG